MSDSGVTFDPKNVGHSNLFFQVPVILPYILNSIWWMNVILLEIGQCNMAFDLKINLGHSDLYFMVQWFFYFKLTWAEVSQGELIVYQWSAVRRRRPSSSTLSNLNISEAGWPVLIKFYV